MDEYPEQIDQPSEELVTRFRDFIAQHAGHLALSDGRQADLLIDAHPGRPAGDPSTTYEVTITERVPTGSGDAEISTTIWSGPNGVYKIVDGSPSDEVEAKESEEGRQKTERAQAERRLELETEKALLDTDDDTAASTSLLTGKLERLLSTEQGRSAFEKFLAHTDEGVQPATAFDLEDALDVLNAAIAPQDPDQTA